MLLNEFEKTYSSAQVFVEEFKTLVDKRSAPFDFVTQVRKGPTLLVGEGNLTFSLALAWKPQISPCLLTATTNEERIALDAVTRKHALQLSNLGSRVWHGLDAARLHKNFPASTLETVILQFPNAGSRSSEEGRTKNFILVRSFLRASACLLRKHGRVLISSVDSPFYRGSFQFFEAAKTAGFKPGVPQPFFPGAFPRLCSYRHQRRR